MAPPPSSMLPSRFSRWPSGGGPITACPSDPIYPLPSVLTAALELLVVAASLALAFRWRRRRVYRLGE